MQMYVKDIKLPGIRAVYKWHAVKPSSHVSGYNTMCGTAVGSGRGLDVAHSRPGPKRVRCEECEKILDANSAIG